jgi:hypothetical protein
MPGTSGSLCAGGSALLISKISSSLCVVHTLICEFTALARCRNLQLWPGVDLWSLVRIVVKYPNHIRHDCGGIKYSRLQANVPITYKGDEATFITAMPAPVPCKQLMISTVRKVAERKYAERVQVVEE